jgi:hypothetical protein
VHAAQIIEMGNCALFNNLIKVIIILNIILKLKHESYWIRHNNMRIKMGNCATCALKWVIIYPFTNFTHFIYNAIVILFFSNTMIVKFKW